MNQERSIQLWKTIRRALSLGLVLLLGAVSAKALDCGEVRPKLKKSLAQYVPDLERDTFRDLAHDQACIWTSPIRLHENRNWTLFVPWAGATAGLITNDRELLRRAPYTPHIVRRARQLSDAGAYALIGAGGVAYLTGLATHNDRLRETGWLAGEAVADGMAVNLATQGISRRNRPTDVSHPGQWFRGGPAFPSDHAMASWAAATVFAHEYPGWLGKTLAYGAATTVSVSRVLSREHSPSDVFVGSSLGFLIGRYVYASRHPDEFSVHGDQDSPKGFSAWKMRPARARYLPLDSPYYPLFERLMAAGYIDSAIVGLRPWTRRECARLVDEATNNVSVNAGPEMQQTLAVLRAEFPSRYAEQDAVPQIPVEELYMRYVGISGTPLRDGFHFGQTLYNDYGRQYWSGSNAYVGGAGAASMGPVSFYVRGEYQHAPGGPVYSSTVQQRLNAYDRTASPILPNSSEVSQFRIIEGYASTSMRNMELSFGKQAMWWGTAWDSGMLASDNSEPIYSFRLSQISPIRLPSIFKYLGPMRFEGFMGKLSGHRLVQGPYIHGQKLTFKPTPNLELGFSRTVVFAGAGHPLNFRSFWRSFISVGDNPNANPDTPGDVGDRRGGFDFAYRLPGLRKWITVYGDFFSEDDPSPVAAIRTSAWNPGIALSHVPGIPKLDLRIEAPNTAPPFPPRTYNNQFDGHFFYYNDAYVEGYTNKDFIYGNWIGRQAKGILASSRYWFSPTNVMEASYRQSTFDPNFVSPGGGNYWDGRISYRRELKQEFAVSGFVQFERWNIPVLAATPQWNKTMTVELSWHPRRAAKK